MWHSVGPNCVVEMIVERTRLADICVAKMKEYKDMELNEDDELDFKTARQCHIFKKAFSKKDVRCRDHDHRTGEYRGAAHQKCNIKYFSNRFIPVFFYKT